jgi:hypothetical protein
MPLDVRKLTALLVTAPTAAVSLVPAALSGSIDINPFGLAPPPQQGPIRLQKKDITLEQLITRVDIPYTFLQPVPLQGIRIPGLGARGVQMLGQNYFVVLANTPYKDLAEVYRENRLRGKSNFVTADSIVHPYFAFTNRALATAIEEHLVPELAALLKAMLETSLADYRQADDSAVRDDIERNIAFLSVAVKLLDSSFAPPQVGRVAALVSADLDAITTGKRATSAIFDREEDFSAYQGQGWYNSSALLRDFYRCREWLSRMAYPVSDVTFGTRGGVGNNFRRSVLLFRCLDLAKVGGKPGYEVWEKLMRAWSLLGSPLAAWQDKTISASEYKPVFKLDGKDVDVALSSLSEPFFRTKLMLAIRKQKPVKLGATSIFDLEDSGQWSNLSTSFRLFPVTGDPEMPWLRMASRNWKEDASQAPSWPLALLVLQAWGAGQASNILTDNLWKLDPQLARVLPELQRSVMRRLPGGQAQPVDDRRWKILSAYFTPYSEGAQSVLRTEMWANRRMESAFAGWVDSHLALGSAEDKPASPAQGGAPAADERQPAKPAYYHYLEPCPELYQRIKEDANRMSEDLYLLGYLSDRLRERFADFSRLAQRLERIAELELQAVPLPPADMKLLGNIDLILEKVVVPLPGTLSISVPGGAGAGMSFGLGRPGLLFIILQSGTRSTLGRGAVYTYYEVPFTNLKPEHWQRKLDFTLVKPPSWTDRFDLVEEQPPARRRAASSQ